MNEQEKQDQIRRLLEMQEHPERYTDDALREMLTDEELVSLLKALSAVKRAVIRHEDGGERDATDEAWQRFSQRHAAEIDALDRKPVLPIKAPKRLYRTWQKAAAVFIGLICIAGLTFAAVHLVKSVRHPATAQAETIQTGGRTSQSRAATHTALQDSLPTDSAAAKPVVFDNVSLNAVLSRLAAHYKVNVDYRNTETANLRLHFVWHPSESLDRVVERLNLFERFHLSREGNKIVVE